MENLSTQPIAQPGFSVKIENLLAKKPIVMQLLRFAAIGVINTALDFLVLNFISKTLGITSGFKLGQINVIGFSLAVIQSYFWNRYWAFNASETVTLLKNFTRLILVGALGALALALVLLGAQVGAPIIYYLIILLTFIGAEVVIWFAFGLSKNIQTGQVKNQFLLFLIVSIIGLVINSVLISLISQRFPLTENADLNKNIAKIVATVVSLIWNFIGYKLLVFKR